jgi:hypothetical protein
LLTWEGPAARHINTMLWERRSQWRALPGMHSSGIWGAGSAHWFDAHANDAMSCSRARRYSREGGVTVSNLRGSSAVEEDHPFAEKEGALAKARLRQAPRAPAKRSLSARSKLLYYTHDHKDCVVC